MCLHAMGQPLVEAIHAQGHAAHQLNQELLEALQNILADAETAEERRTPADWDFACTQAIEAARAAITKATATPDTQ